jgi:phenylacetate-CoA ligase
MTTTDRYLEPDVECAPRKELLADQEAQLLDLVPYVYERAPLYRRVWGDAGVTPADIRSIDDFTERVPFITKDMIRDFHDRYHDPYGGLLCVDPKDVTTIGSSSGTTGDPTFFPEQWTESPPLPVGYLRALWEIGLRPGDCAITSSSTFRGYLHDMYSCIGVLPLMVDSWMGAWSNLMEVFEHHRPAYVQIFAPFLPELTALSERYDLKNVFSSLKGVSYAGEPVPARMAARIRDEWDVEIYMYTSAGDTGIAFECSAHDGYHIWEDTALAEHLVLDGGVAAERMGVGELVCTSLDDVVAPLIRYRSDDLVRYTDDTCACGRTHARVWPVGRKGDETVVQGHSILPMEVWQIVEQLPETESGLFQIVRPEREMPELRVRVGYEPAVTADLSGLDARLTNEIADRLGVPTTIELVPESELRERASVNKLPRITKS